MQRSLSLTSCAGSHQRHVSRDLIWFPISNTQTGELLAEVPLPADWKVTSQEWVAPGDVRARAVKGEFLSGVDTGIVRSFSRS